MLWVGPFPLARVVQQGPHHAPPAALKWGLTAFGGAPIWGKGSIRRLKSEMCAMNKRCRDALPLRIYLLTPLSSLASLRSCSGAQSRVWIHPPPGTKSLKLKLPLTQEMLGTKAANPDVFPDYIARKHPSGTPQRDELENAGHREPRSQGRETCSDYRLLGTCPAPALGSADITSLYTARFGVPPVAKKVYSRSTRSLTGGKACPEPSGASSWLRPDVPPG